MSRKTDTKSDRCHEFVGAEPDVDVQFPTERGNRGAFPAPEENCGLCYFPCAGVTNSHKLSVLFLNFFINLFLFILFILGCVGSSLLHVDFL